MTFSQNIPVTTPTGRQGTVLIGDGNPSMPLHCLVQLETGECLWILATLLTASPSMT